MRLIQALEIIDDRAAITNRRDCRADTELDDAPGFPNRRCGSDRGALARARAPGAECLHWNTLAARL
jgi:hypothetical protein